MERTFELCEQAYKNGRRHFKALLYVLQPPECVVNGVGTQYNKNGITFLEEFAKDKLDSIPDMSVTVSFIDDERTMISDHGFTGYHVEDGLPTYNDATLVGHFIRGYIDDVEIDGVVRRAVFGEGYLDEMRYHDFVEKLIESLNSGYSVEGSIEIYRDADHSSIVYQYGYKEFGRIPMYYIHSGWSFVLNAADTTSHLLEINNTNKEEDHNQMDENKIVEIIQKTISESNSAKDSLNTQITELNTQIKAKDEKIAELESAKSETENKVSEQNTRITELETRISELESQVADKDKELNECKKKELNSALDEKLSGFSEDEQKYASVEINAFREDPLNGDVDAIVMKINAGIGAKVKADAAKVAERNSTHQINNDIFSEINSAESDDDGSIF